jgi:hypothetical protein
MPAKLTKDPRVTGIDALSRSGAHEVADRIRAFWELRGYRPKVRVEQVVDFESLFVVRSNMVGGFPVMEAR